MQCGLAGSASHQQSLRMLEGMKGRRMGVGRVAFFMLLLCRAVGETLCPDQGEFREFCAGIVQAATYIRLAADIDCCRAGTLPPFNTCFALLENLNEFNPSGVVVPCWLCHVR